MPPGPRSRTGSVVAGSPVHWRGGEQSAGAPSSSHTAVHHGRVQGLDRHGGAGHQVSCLALGAGLSVEQALVASLVTTAFHQHPPLVGVVGEMTGGTARTHRRTGVVCKYEGHNRLTRQTLPRMTSCSYLLQMLPNWSVSRRGLWREGPVTWSSVRFSMMVASTPPRPLPGLGGNGESTELFLPPTPLLDLRTKLSLSPSLVSELDFFKPLNTLKNSIVSKAQL